MRILFILALLIPNFAKAYISVSPSQVRLGAVKVNHVSPTGYVSVTNIGNAYVNIYVRNGCFGAFWSTSSCYSQLSPGMSCSMTVRFQPRHVGFQSCTIDIRDSEGFSSTVFVTGQGVNW